MELAEKTPLSRHPGVMNRFRARRMELFLRLAGPVPRPATLLDLGGTSDFWRGQVPEGISLSVLNLFEQEPVAGVRVVVGDACNLARFESGSFDIVFSNSVLGHVGGWERQRRLAGEVRRVGRRYFVQTPNQSFLIDWRTLMPFFHWLPPAKQAWVLQRIPVGRYKRVRDPQSALQLATRVRNVTLQELREMFPEATVVSERVLGLTKSFMVHHGFEA
jgi:ubiquinone/menaquinone biosynthesis C-methylase UbiE